MWPSGDVRGHDSWPPYLAAADVDGGPSAYLTVENRNGVLFQPSPRSIAECIWRTLDTLKDFKPREKALRNMCRAVAVMRLKDALKNLENSLLNLFRCLWMTHHGTSDRVGITAQGGRYS